MRSIATLVGAAALVGALVVPAPAVAAESPLPQLTAGVCQAKDAELPTTASVLGGPFVRGVSDVPQAGQVTTAPQLCSAV